MPGELGDGGPTEDRRRAGNQGCIAPCEPRRRKARVERLVVVGIQPLMRYAHPSGVADELQGLRRVERANDANGRSKVSFTEVVAAGDEYSEDQIAEITIGRHQLAKSVTADPEHGTGHRRSGTEKCGFARQDVELPHEHSGCRDPYRGFPPGLAAPEGGNT
jgi:hypothetical protein